MTRVLLLSRYGVLPPPSRYRFYQFLPYLRQRGMEFEVAPLLSDEYVSAQYSSRRFSLSPLPAIYSRRIRSLMNSSNFDLVWLEKEALPWFPVGLEHLFGLSRVPYVVDYDDATFHTYDRHSSKFVRWMLGDKIARLMAGAAIVVAGNEYLAEHARAAGARRIEMMPTVVDLLKYPSEPAPLKAEPFTIGWIGSPANSRHLQMIGGALEKFCSATGSRVHIVGGWNADLPAGLPVQYFPWSEDTEVESMRRFDVGIMPLYPGPWENGKCGLKLINYMAAGLPTVASPVAVNRQIIDEDITGFKVDSEEEWIAALTRLRDDPALRRRLGAAGRAKVERQYSLAYAAPKMADWLLSVAGKTSARASGTSTWVSQAGKN